MFSPRESEESYQPESGTPCEVLALSHMTVDNVPRARAHTWFFRYLAHTGRGFYNVMWIERREGDGKGDLVVRKGVGVVAGEYWDGVENSSE